MYAQAWLGLDAYSDQELKELEDCADFLRRRREGGEPWQDAQSIQHSPAAV